MKYEVKTITYDECKEWLLFKHYAKRMCSISYSFGLFCGSECVGVCTIGRPASPNVCKGICGESESKYVYELNRLVVKDGLKDNSLSWFVAKCLKMLPKMILISYADSGQGHNGYIYQATNFIYLGKGKPRTHAKSAEGKHPRHYDLKTGIREEWSPKHRYLYLIGSKKQKKKWMNVLRYETKPYPKGDNKRYDTSFKPNTQTKLF